MEKEKEKKERFFYLAPSLQIFITMLEMIMKGRREKGMMIIMTTWRWDDVNADGHDDDSLRGSGMCRHFIHKIGK